MTLNGFSSEAILAKALFGFSVLLAYASFLPVGSLDLDDDGMGGKVALNPGGDWMLQVAFFGPIAVAGLMMKLPRPMFSVPLCLLNILLILSARFFAAFSGGDGFGSQTQPMYGRYLCEYVANIMVVLCVIRILLPGLRALKPDAA